MSADTKVLIVDDRSDNLLALEATLEGLDVSVEKARSGAEALRHLLATDYAVILLDVQMPEMDGYETARLIKTRARNASTPIIFLTAINRDPDQQLYGYSSGAVDYLAKPFDPEVLRSKVTVFAALYDQARVIDEQNHRLADNLDDQERSQAALSRHAVDLMRSNAALERFASVMGTELLEPLHVVLGLLELVTERHADGLDDEGALLLRRARSRSVEMADRVTKHLAEARSTAEPIRREPAELDAILAQARRDLAARIDERGATLTADPLPAIVGDEWQLVQVFVHFLSRALDVGRQSQPEIHVGLSRRGDDWVIGVTDDGPGIDPEERVRMFSMPLTEEDDESRAGLAMCRRVVENHGGSVWSDSAPGGGSTIFFSLPVADAA